MRVVDADGCDLTGSPASIGTAPDASQPAVQSVGAGARYTSAFGGFWPDLSNAEAVIAGKQALGWISEEEAEQLRAWRRDGFVILPQAVSADDIDRLDDDVERIWAGTSKHRCFVEFWENDVKTVRTAGPQFRDQSVKLLDLFAGSPAALSVTFAPPLHRFLSILFERPALAFQSLYIPVGIASGRPPGFSLRSRVIAQGVRGELDRTRRHPGKLWRARILRRQPSAGRLSVRRTPQVDAVQILEYRRYVDSLRARCVGRGLEHRLFRPKKGDVLVWHSDLAHGGSPIVTPGLTRKSLVTHYCPADCLPGYDDGGARSLRHRFNDLAYYSYPARD